MTSPSISKRSIKVFIASPGDLVAERIGFKEQIDQLNDGFGDGLGVKFVPLGWEDTLASTGRRVQSLINQELDTCDVFVLAMHRRWGQPAPDSAFSSYTEEEFQRAIERFKKTGVPEIFVFFKSVDDASIADPGPELSKVLKFKIELERTRSVRYRTFIDPSAFRREIDQHLRAFARGGTRSIPAEPERLPLPLDLIERVERAEADARKRAEAAEARALAQQEAAQKLIDQARAHEAQAEASNSLLAIQSVGAASEGHVEEAHQLFAKATLGTTNTQILYLAFEFYWRTGPLSVAEDLLKRWLAISGWERRTAETATALSNLGLIYHARGDLGRAEEMHRKALALDKSLRRRKDMSHQHSNLGLIHYARGELDQALDAHRKAITLDKQLGNSDGLSHQYSSLGLIYQARGDHDRAEEMHFRALKLAAGSDGNSLPKHICTISVVVHVVYKQTSENVSDAQIQSQIAVLNQDYRARNTDLSKVPYPFRSLIGDARIEFRLATKDPSNQTTSGITRTKTRHAGFDTNDGVKSQRSGGIDPWDPKRYLNIWVCNLQGGPLGYAQFPGGRASHDGVVINYAAFGTLGKAKAPFDKGRTTTHTIGHYLNLQHVWGSDDSVADTPIHEGPNYGNPTFPHLSGHNGPYGDMFMNFMDYVDDEAMHMFTKGQVLRMHQTLDGPRSELVRSQNRTRDRHATRKIRG